jgi:hypothetical protein
MLQDCLKSKVATYAEITWAEHDWATGVLSTRGMWWLEEDGNYSLHLVPLTDFVNCRQLPVAHAVHRTRLDATRQFAVTKANAAFRHVLVCMCDRSMSELVQTGKRKRFLRIMASPIGSTSLCMV